MKARNSGRLGRLRHYFNHLTYEAGDQVFIGIASQSDIHYAAKTIGIRIKTKDTGEKVTRDDGVMVPVYLVTFQARKLVIPQG